MNHLGLDVHSKATVWCLLDHEGKQIAHGKTDTTAPALTQLITQCQAHGELTVGQEVGGQSYFVHDTISQTGTPVLSFNAHQLRMIASSRKKSDRRDAYWIAKSLQTGMMPHPVFMPNASIRDLRLLVSLRDKLVRDGRSWWIRAQALVRGHGEIVPKGVRSSEGLLQTLQRRPEGLNAALAYALQVCATQQSALAEQEHAIKIELIERAAALEPVKLLQTIPGIGMVTAIRLYALIGEVTRFPNARRLASYVGLVPIVRQSGESRSTGAITCEGSPTIRAALVQCAHAILRSKSAEAAPLRTLADRIKKNRSRFKIAVVALARHLLRITYYVLRDRVAYDPRLLRTLPSKEDAVS